MGDAEKHNRFGHRKLYSVCIFKMTQEANKKLLWKIRLMLIRDCVHSAQKALRTGGRKVDFSTKHTGRRKVT